MNMAKQKQNPNSDVTMLRRFEYLHETVSGDQLANYDHHERRRRVVGV